MRVPLFVLPALALLMLGGGAAVGAGKGRAVRGPHSLLPGVKSLLWVGAHPDDEVLAAPLLAQLCIREKVTCTFLVLTRGEAGLCGLPGGCGFSLGDLRAVEMGRAATLFNAQLVIWNLPDGAGLADASAPGWDALSGSHQALVTAISSFLAGVHPDMVLTFDPRHGSTCHPDHRATGRLLVEALSGDDGPALYLLESSVAVTDNPRRIVFSAAAPDTPSLIRFDGRAPMRPDATGWDVLLEDMRCHPSQFDDAWLDAAAANPPEAQATFFGEATAMMAHDDVQPCR
jgi:LmbE family N-acetylglucosaminyl deacetylase